MNRNWKSGKLADNSQSVLMSLTGCVNQPVALSSRFLNSILSQAECGAPSLLCCDVQKRIAVAKFHSLNVVWFISCLITKQICFCSYQGIKEVTRIVNNFQILEWNEKTFNG